MQFDCSCVSHTPCTERFKRLIFAPCLCAILLLFSAGVLPARNSVVNSVLVSVNSVAEMPDSISVVRTDNNSALPDAVVKIIPLNEQHRKPLETVGLTNKDGVFAFAYTEPCVILVSHIGFSTVIDTLRLPETKRYFISPTSKSINDVVVTGQYSENSAKNSLYEVKVISSETLKAKGANNLREALQSELKIDLGNDQVFGSTMSINGIAGEGVKIMVDGVPIVGRLDGKLDLSQININNIERIEIVEGPLSVIYGTDAMGGVVNIITKTFQTEKVNLNLKGYYESVGQYNIELNGGFAFKKNQIYLSGGRNFFNGFASNKSIERFQDWKPKEQYFADAKYIYYGNRVRVSLSGSFFREMLLDRSAPKQTLQYDNGDTSWTYVGADYHSLTYRPRAAASLMYRFKDNYQFDALLAYSGFIRFRNLYSKNLVTLKETLADASQQDTAVHHQIVFRSTYSMPAWKNRINFQLGIDLNQEYLTQQRVQNGQQQKLGDYAAFGSVRVSLVPGLDVMPAIRFSYNTRFAVPLIPSVNLRYNYKDKLIFRISYGRGYRAPSLKELYLTFFDSNHNIKGNADLRPEDGHCVNGSLTYNAPIKKSGTLNFGVSGFYNNQKNKIDLKLIGINAYEYANVKSYITYGGNVSLGYQRKRFEIKSAVQLTWYNMSNTSSGSDKAKMFSPDFTASASYLIPKAEIGVNVFYKYNGQKPLFSVNSSVQAGTRAAYHWLDVSFSRNFWKNRIQVIVGAKNLVGVVNVATSGVTMIGHGGDANFMNIGWGRTFFSTLVLHFGK